MTAYFSDVLPRLTEKYSSDATVLRALLSVVTFIDVSHLAEKVPYTHGPTPRQKNVSAETQWLCIRIHAARARALSTHTQTQTLKGLTTMLHTQLLRQTSPDFLFIAAGALAVLAKAPALALMVGPEVAKATAELVKQLERRLNELSVRPGAPRRCSAHIAGLTRGQAVASGVAPRAAPGGRNWDGRGAEQRGPVPGHCARARGGLGRALGHCRRLQRARVRRALCPRGAAGVGGGGMSGGK